MSVLGVEICGSILVYKSLDNPNRLEFSIADNVRSWLEIQPVSEHSFQNKLLMIDNIIKLVSIDVNDLCLIGGRQLNIQTLQDIKSFVEGKFVERCLKAGYEPNLANILEMEGWRLSYFDYKELRDFWVC